MSPEEKPQKTQPSEDPRSADLPTADTILDKPRKLPPATLAGVAVAGLVLIGLAFWLFGGGDGGAKKSSTGQGDKSDESGAKSVFDEETPSAAVAFNADWLGLDDARLDPIFRLFDEIVDATASGDRAAFLQQIDVDRFFDEMKRRPAMPRLKQSEESSARAAAEQDIFIPATWTDYEIARVHFFSDARLAMVYSHLWDTTGMEHRTRWWIIQHRGAWKIVDWEILDFGTRASNEAAIFHAYRDTAALEEYDECIAAMATVNGLIAEGDLSAAANLIRQVEEIDPPPPLRDKVWMLLANAWSYCGRTDEAMSCLRRIAEPDALPRALLGLALCNAEWGRYEKALAQATRYEALLGRFPEVQLLRAQCFLALGREDESIDGLRAALEVEPNQPALLRTLGIILPPEDKSIVGDYVTRCDEPVTMATMLAEAYYAEGDVAAIAAMAELLKEAPDASATITYLDALTRRLDDNLPYAGRLLEKALDEELYPAMRLAYSIQYYDVMVDAGQMIETYRDATDPVAAFSYLSECALSDEYDVSTEEFEELINRHRKAFPKDPWLFYYAGSLRAKQKQYSGAATLFAAGMANTTDLRAFAALREEHLRVLHALGKDLEAYQTIPPPATTFAELSDYYSWSAKLDAKQTATLKSLVEAHRAVVSSDPWLDFCAGVVAENEQDFDEADRLFALGQEAAEANPSTAATIGRDYRERRLESRLRSGKILPALEEVLPADETFDYLAGRLADESKTTQLKSLIDAYRRVAPEAVALTRWQAELSWATRDYAGAIETLGPRWQELSERLPGWVAALLRERLVRSYLRLGQTDKAQAIAERMYDRGDALPLILVAATQRDVDKTTRLMTELLPAQNLVNAIYFDEDVGAIVRGEGFAPLRQACPPGLRHDLDGTTVVLLLKQPRQPDEEAIRQALAEAIGSDSGASLEIVRPSGEPSDDVPLSLVVGDGERTYIFTFGPGRYVLDDRAVRGVTLPALSRAVEEHAGWVSVHASVLNRRSDEDPLASACRLAASLLGDDCLAVHFANRGRFVPVESTTADALRTIQATEDLASLGEGDAWLDRDTQDVEAKRKAALQQRRLPQFLAAYAKRKPNVEGYLKIELRLGPLSEPHWVTVEKILRDPQGNRRYLARFTANSFFAPYCAAGEWVCVEPYDVADWRIGEPR